MIRASCHCGSIQLTAPSVPTTVTHCNCSICYRLGAVWAYYTQADITVVAEPDVMESYIWGDRDIAFCRCGRCGCTTHYIAVERGDGERIAINGRCWPLGTLDAIPIRHFDGAAM